MLITRCPKCQTAFQVPLAALAHAQGWAQCGKCAHVFEAQVLSELASTPAAASGAPIAQAAKVTPHRGQQGWGSLLAVLLLLLLAWQVLIWQRHIWVAQMPMLRPWVSQLCGSCEITWPQESQAVLIEGSRFAPNPAGGYTVSLDLKNTKTYPVAMPALELSLIDSQDSVLLRRVLLQTELTPVDHLQAMQELTLNLSFDVDPGLQERVMGFRAFIFYP